MQTKKPILWMSAAVLAAAAFAATMWTGRSEDTTPEPPAEPDLFTFVKPLDEAYRSAATTREPAQERQHERPREAATANAPLTPAQLVATEQAVREMRAQGADEDAIYRLRATTLTAEAATQLARMEREEATWQARVDAYLSERDKLVTAGDGVADVDPSLALQQLRDAHFTAEEQQRLNAYEAAAMPRLTLQ